MPSDATYTLPPTLLPVAAPATAASKVSRHGRPVSPSRLHVARRTLLALWILAAAATTHVWADDLENMQGTWVSEDWPWTVEFRDSAATFRGVNPFQYQPQMDEPLPEFTVRFNLDSTQSPKRLHVNEEDFAKFRDLLESSGVTAYKKDFAKPLPGIYQIGSARDGQAPNEMRLEFYSPNRRWVTKGFNDQAFAHLFYVPSRKLRRLLPAELAHYAKVSGVWQGELRRGDKAIFQGSCAIVPGWVLYDFHQKARMPLVLSDKADEFALRQMVQNQANPLAQLLGAPRELELTWRGKFKLESASSLAIEASSLPNNPPGRLVNAAGNEVAFDQYVQSEEFQKMLKDLEKEPNERNQALLQELKRLAEQGSKAPTVTTTLTKMKQPTGEHPLLGLVRALRPELPSQEHLTGAWKLTKQAKFDLAKSDVAKGRNHYEPVEITDAETWTFADGKLTITSASGARNEVYFAQHQVKYGFLKLKHQDSDQDLAGFFPMKLVGESLQLSGSFKSAQSAQRETWQYTLSREAGAAKNAASPD